MLIPRAIRLKLYLRLFFFGVGLRLFLDRLPVFFFVMDLLWFTFRAMGRQWHKTRAEAGLQLQRP